MQKRFLFGPVVLGLALAACNQAPSPEMQELADKAAIEELLVSYYSHFGGTENEDFGAYYTEDAVFDVNGIVSTGREEIVALYNGMDDPGAEPSEGDEPAEAPGVFHMLITNIEVDIEGDTATAKMFWTGILNPDPFAPPVLQEHGREYDRLERQEDGSWLISKRVVLADSAIPEMFRETYKQQLDYDITKGE
ncbi:MAG TPA: nuclear transport factor 2 family protein [Sphingomonadaceae bacterium]|nr:nuclear transport factor 2 family protein [Sphingomonadaceae bacterium]